MMEESKAVAYFSKQDLRNPRTSQKAENERLHYRYYKNTQEVNTRPGHDASRQYQETDYQTHFDYNHDQDSSKVMQDINRYYESPSNTEIVIGNVRPITKIQKIYVKESDVVTRNLERNCHQIETETRHFQCVANVPMLSQIYEETRKLMVDASVGNKHSGLHETHKRRNYTNYRRHIRHRTKNQNKCVGLGADSQKNMQVHQKLSPIKNVRSGATSPIYADQSHEIHHAMEVNGQATSRRKEEQVVYNSTLTLTSQTSDSKGYELAEDTEAVGDFASLRTIVTREQETDSFMIHKSYDRGEFKSTETLTKDYYNLLDIDTSSESAKLTYPTVTKVSSKRLLKTKLKKKQNDKMTNCSKTKLTHVIIEDGKNFLRFIRRRIGALTRRLGLEEKKINHTQNPTLKDSSPCFASSPSYKDVSISSDPPSLVARPYYIYSHQKIHCNNAKIKFQLPGKKNLDSDKCSTNVNTRPQTKQVKQARNIKNNRKEINTLNSILSDNTAAKLRIPGKKYITACRCNVNNNVEMKISDNTEAKIEIAPKTAIIKNTRKYTNSWITQFISNRVNPNEKKMRVRWDNITYQSSDSVIFELIDFLCKDTGLVLRSSRIEDSEKHSQIQHNSPFHQTIPVFVLHSCENKIPIDNETLLCRKGIKNQYQSTQSRVKVTKQKRTFEQGCKQSVRTEIVLRAMHNKSKSYENYRIDTPCELSGYNKDSENQSEEMVYQVVNYETTTSTITDETIIEDYEQLAVTQDCGYSMKIPERSTFMRIVDYETKSPIDSVTTEDEGVNTDSIINGHECTSQSYANASRSESLVLGIYSKSCPNFLKTNDVYKHNYIDDICHVDSSNFKQSGMTAMINQLKRIWHTLQRKEALSGCYIDCVPNVLEVFRNTKYLAGSWAASLSDGVDKAKPVRMKKTSIPSREPGIFESHEDEDINKNDKKYARITRVNVLPFDGDVNPQKLSHGHKNLALPLRSLHDREAVNKQTKSISRMQVSGDIIKSTKYRTIAATSSMSIVVLKLLLSSINMAKKRRKSTRSHSTQFTTLFQDSHYTQYSFPSKTKKQPNLKSQSTQHPSEKSFSIPKATQVNQPIQNCQEYKSKSFLHYVVSLKTPSKQSNTKRIKKQNNCKSASKHSCSKSSKNIQKAMCNIRAKVLHRPYPKSKDCIRQSLCKIMDHFMECPLCTLKSLGGKPSKKKTHFKKAKKKCTKRQVISDCPALSKDILPWTPTKSPIEDSVDSYQESKSEYSYCLHSKDVNKYHISKQLSKKSGTNSNVIGECPASFKDVTTCTLAKAASSDNVQSVSSDEKLTENGNPSRYVSRGQIITKSRPSEDGSLSKKYQASVNKGLRQNFTVKLSVKVSRKPRKQSVYTVNVPITPRAKCKETKDLPIVQTEIAKPTKSLSRETNYYVIVLQPSSVYVKSENTKQKHIPRKNPIGCSNGRLLIPVSYKQHEKKKSLEKPKTIALMKETAHTATVLPLTTLISSLPRRSKSAVQRTKKKQPHSLQSLHPVQSNPGKNYFVMKCSETRKKDEESTTSDPGNMIQTVTIPSQNQTLIDDNDVKGQKETKPPAICSSGKDTNKPVKQQTYATSAAFKVRLTNFYYVVDQSGLSTQCKLDTPALSLKSGEFNENVSQYLDTDIIRFDDVKRKCIFCVNPDKDCLDTKETASTELLNSITTEEKTLPGGTKIFSDESSSKSLSEEPLGSSRDNSSSKQSDQSYDSEVTPQLQQQHALSVDNSYKIDTNCVCISCRNKTLTLESSGKTTENVSKSLKPLSKSPETFSESTDMSPISQKSSKCYCLYCQDTKSKNGSNGEKSSQSSSTNSTIGSSSKKSSEEFTQSVQEKFRSKKSDSHKTTSDDDVISKNASGDSRIGSPQSVCRPCNKHTSINDNLPFKKWSEKGKKKKLPDIIIKYKIEIDSSEKETSHGSDSTKSTKTSSFRNGSVLRREISSTKNNSPATSQKSLEGEECRESQDEMKTKLKKCSKYTSSQKELKNKQNKENKSDSEMKSDDGNVTTINPTCTFGTRTYSQKLNEENMRMKEQINFLKKSCESFSFNLPTKITPKKASGISLCQPKTETAPKKTKIISIQTDMKTLPKQFSDSSRKSCCRPPKTKTIPIEAKTISKQTKITTIPKKSLSSRIALEQTQFDKFSNDIIESEFSFARDNKEECSGSKTADFKREDKIQRIDSIESQDSRREISRSRNSLPETSQKNKKKRTRVKKIFTIRDHHGRVIVERRDYSADDEEELEDKHDSDYDNKRAVEIRFTFKFCPGDKTEGDTIDNVVKNKKTLEMCQTYNKNYTNQNLAKSYFDDAIKPNDVNVRITIRNIAHKSNQTNTDIGNKLSDKVIKHYEDCFIPMKSRTNGISGYRNTTLAENSICILKSYSSKSEVKPLIDKYQKVDILDLTNELNKFNDLRMKGKSASSPDIYKQRNAAFEDSDNKRFQIKILPVEDLDNTTKQQRWQKLQNDTINLTNEKSVIKNKPRSDVVLTNVELNNNESKDVQFVGHKSRQLNNTDSMNINYYSMSTPPDCVMHGSFVVLNEGLPEWRSDVSTWNNLRKKLKKCVCASLARKLDLQDFQCSCEKHRLATKKISCQISRDNLTFQTAKQPPLKNSHHKRTTAAFMTNRSEAHKKSNRNKHRRNKDKTEVEKHRFDYKSKTTEMLFETMRYRETSSISQENKTKTFNKMIDNPDILQSYAMKKAVLEIYKENRSTGAKDNDLIGNLPKFNSR